MDNIEPKLKTDIIVLSSIFPMRDNEIINLQAAFDDLQKVFDKDCVKFNDSFCQLCLKMEGCTIQITYKGKIKFYSHLTEQELLRIYCDLWADFFKKNVCEQTI